MALLRWLPVLLCASAASAFGCAADPPTPAPTPSAVTATLPPRPGADAAPNEPAPEACSGEQRIDLVASRYEGQTLALYVPAFVGERASLLHLDSASSTTLLFARDATGWVSDYARATVGCETLSLPGYGGLGVLPDVEGRPVVGMMGADWLTAAPTLLDVDRGQLVRRPRDLGAVDGGVTVPYQLLGGKYLLDVTFDGKPVRVILDTGAGHTVFVDPTPRPGETEIVTEDALGNPLVLHQGTIELAVGGRSKVVTLLRATRFEILEQISAQLGVPIDGLIGLSALRAFYTDHARGVLTLAM